MSHRQRIVALHLIVAALAFQLACSYGRVPEEDRQMQRKVFVSDESINTHVEQTMTAQGLSDVKVKTQDGQVFLSGYVDDEEQRQAAEESARQTPGVVQVRNEIVVCKKPNVNKPGGPRRC